MKNGSCQAQVYCDVPKTELHACVGTNLVEVAIQECGSLGLGVERDILEVKTIPVTFGYSETDKANIQNNAKIT